VNLAPINFDTPLPPPEGSGQALLGRISHPNTKQIENTETVKTMNLASVDFNTLLLPLLGVN
jgi:hypothetical protein